MAEAVRAKLPEAVGALGRAPALALSWSRDAGRVRSPSPTLAKLLNLRHVVVDVAVHDLLGAELSQERLRASTVST